MVEIIEGRVDVSKPRKAPSKRARLSIVHAGRDAREPQTGEGKWIFGIESGYVSVVEFPVGYGAEVGARVVSVVDGKGSEFDIRDVDSTGRRAIGGFAGLGQLARHAGVANIVEIRFEQYLCGYRAAVERIDGNQSGIPQVRQRRYLVASRQRTAADAVRVWPTFLNSLSCGPTEGIDTFLLGAGSVHSMMFRQKLRRKILDGLPTAWPETSRTYIGARQHRRAEELGEQRTLTNADVHGHRKPRLCVSADFCNARGTRCATNVGGGIQENIFI